MAKEKKSPDYEVGYGRPPVDGRWPPGTSGNKSGKKKGTRSLKSDLQDELAESITLREHGREIRISKQRAMVKSTLAKAIRGDTRAVSKIFELVMQLLGIDQDIQDSRTISAEDQQILERFMRRQANEGNSNE